MPRNERLQMHRIQRNWRQRDVADQLGVDVITIQRWEQGSQHPRAYYRAKLCALFGLSAQELGLLEEVLSPALGEREEPAGERANVSAVEGEALWTIPYTRNPHFTGREEVLRQLELQFAPQKAGHQVTLTREQVIRGLGGIGKTQIALEYAYRAHKQQRYTHIFWINVASEETILTNFVALAHLLPIFPARQETDPRKIAAEVISWLEHCIHPWLLIFDNVDDLLLVHHYVPVRSNGCVLLTTRASAIGSLAASIEVEKMDLMESTRLLLRRAQREALAAADEIATATTLVVALAQFPLAIDQAGAYIDETGCSLNDYGQIYQKHRHRLLARRGMQTTGYPESVATTWSLSFQAVAQINPAAAQLLQLCALLASDHIPEELLTQGSLHWPVPLQQAAADRLTFNQMLEALLAYSLVKRLAKDQMLSIHRLVQVVQIDQMEADERRQWAERVVRVVHALFPRDPQDVSTWPECRRYLEQAEAGGALIQQYQLQLFEAAEILDRVGIYHREHASYQAAEPLFQYALSLRQQLEGPSHLSVARSLNNLAVLYLRQGKYRSAEPLFLRALDIRQQQMGAHHRDVGQVLHNLALLYVFQGRCKQAEPLFLQALFISEQQLGAQHEKTAVCLHNLAEVYGTLGAYEQAETLYQRALVMLEQQLGAEHPLIAHPLMGLARLSLEQDGYRQAETLYQRALAILEQQLGPEHPYIAEALTGLANLSLAQGGYEQAETLFQRALWMNERQLGSEHPHIALMLTGLASLSLVQGGYERAETLFQRALWMNEQASGPESSFLIEPLLGLAALAIAQGQYAQAEPLYRQALQINTRQLGAESPGTARIIHDLAALEELQSNQQAALSLYAQALSIRKNVLGPEHPQTRETRQRFVTLQRKSGLI